MDPPKHTSCFFVKKDVPHPAPVLFIFDFVLKTFKILPQNTWKQSISIVADNLAFVLDSVKSLERRWTYIKRSQNSVLKIVLKVTGTYQSIHSILSNL